MKVTIEGVVYEFDESRFMLTEAMEIQEKTGLTFVKWSRGIKEADAFAIKGLVYLLRKRNGESPDWDTLDVNLMEVELDGEPPPDPTPAEAA